MTNPDEAVQVTRKGPKFGVVDVAVVRDPSLPAQAVRAYVVLATYADQDRSAFPSRTTLAADMGCSTDTLDRALRALQKVGVLSIEHRAEGGQQKSSLYVLNDMKGGRTGAEGGPQGCPQGGRTGAARGGRTGAAHNNTTKNNTTEHLHAADASSEPGLFAVPNLPEPPPAEPTPAEAARVILDYWWKQQDPKPSGRGAWHSGLNVVKGLLEVGHTPKAVQDAALSLAPPLSIGRMEIALNKSKAHRAPDGGIGKSGIGAISDWDSLPDAGFYGTKP